MRCIVAGLPAAGAILTAELHLSSQEAQLPLPQAPSAPADNTTTPAKVALPPVKRNSRAILNVAFSGSDEDDEDLIAFLEALSDDPFDREVPARVPRGLPVGGRIR